jgi:hypothetical protein
VNVFGHKHISHDDKAIALAGLLKDGKQAIAIAGGAQKRQSPVTGTGDKVQVMSAVTAMQPAGHDQQHGTGGTASRPCKKRKDGAPTVSKWERQNNSERRATRPFDNQKFVITSANERAQWAGFTAHTTYGDGTSYIDAPNAGDLPQTMLHEVLHGLYYGYTDVQLASAGVKGFTPLTPNPIDNATMSNASHKFSNVMSQSCHY